MSAKCAKMDKHPGTSWYKKYNTTTKLGKLNKIAMRKFACLLANCFLYWTYCIQEIQTPSAFVLIDTVKRHCIKLIVTVEFVLWDNRTLVHQKGSDNKTGFNFLKTSFQYFFSSLTTDNIKVLFYTSFMRSFLFFQSSFDLLNFQSEFWIHHFRLIHHYLHSHEQGDRQQNCANR